MELLGLYLYAGVVGSIPTAYLIGRWVRGIDIRQYGSGNVGGTNVFYAVGRRWVVPLGLFEILVKGASPVWLGRYGLDMETSSFALVGASLLAIAGHNWSVFLKFTGGRGVAATVGALLALAPVQLGFFVAVALGGWAVTRSSAIWVYVGLLLLPLWSWLLNQPTAVTVFCGGLVGVVSVKRLVANWEALPQDLPRGQVLLNRLFRDRDVSSREEWMGRTPTNERADG